MLLAARGCPVASLPDVKIYRSTSYIYPPTVSEWIASPVQLIPIIGEESPGKEHAYIGLHSSTGFPPLHQAVNQGVHRLSFCLFYTRDHRCWSEAVFNEWNLAHQVTILMMVILRADRSGRWRMTSDSVYMVFPTFRGIPFHPVSTKVPFQWNHGVVV